MWVEIEYIKDSNECTQAKMQMNLSSIDDTEPETQDTFFHQTIRW